MRLLALEVDVNASIRTGLSFLGFGACALIAIWFKNHYFQIGPEWSEPVVFVVGWLFVLGLLATSFVWLVRSVKALRPPAP